MADYLRLVLEGPLLAFGGEAVDARGVIADFPGASMLTGLLANALGWRRSDRNALAGLQARLHYAARIDRNGTRLTDFQTAQLGRNDQGWTTRGVPQGRAGGTNTYNSPHLRQRDYDADKRVVVALQLDPAEERPTLADLEAALDEPARPLFLGRKPCLPSGRICAGIVDADGFLAALATMPLSVGAAPRVLLPGAEPPERGDETRPWSGQRNWHSGVHGGTRTVRIRSLPAQEAAP
jgi:CRISPR system Cascade subunit CasD